MSVRNSMTKFFLGAMLSVVSFSTFASNDSTLVESADFCSVYPITVSASLLFGSIPGQEYDNISTGTGQGNYSWLSWNGKNNANSIAEALIPPGNSDQYINPRNANDTKIEIGDWVEGAPGVKNSKRIRENLDELLNKEIILPVWSSLEEKGSQREYKVENFAVVELNDYSLSGKGYFSFTFKRFTRCYNLPPAIVSEPVTQGAEGFQYSYQLEVDEPDDDPLQFSLLDGPQGLTIGANGLIEWLPGYEDEGEYQVGVKVTDPFDQSDEQHFTLIIANTNRAPQITSQALLEADENTLYEYRVTAIDLDGDDLSYELFEGPEGLNIDPETGVVTWVLGYEDAGTYPVSVKVTDDGGLSDEQSYQLTINNVNRTQEITSLPVTSGAEAIEYTYQLQATDPDQDELQYQLLNSPEGMTIDEMTGLVRWLPSYEQSGTYDITIRVSDYSLAVQQQYKLKIINVNRPPEITSTPSKVTDEGELYRYAVQGEDPDRDSLTYHLKQAPAGMVIDRLTGELEWKPGFEAAGEYEIELLVKDPEGATDSQSYTLTVLNVNRAPVIESDPVTVGKEGEFYQYSLLASDPDNDKLVYTIQQAPDGFVIDSGTGQVSWNPGYLTAGIHQIVVQVSDGDLVAEQSYQLTIENSNRLPEISSFPPREAVENTVYDYQVNVIDPDTDDIHSYTLLESPEGMDISTVLGEIYWQPSRP
ncbi:MAG TPA: putative Ig domain-containing protein [Gammaproteobacteria bacterium]